MSSWGALVLFCEEGWIYELNIMSIKDDYPLPQINNLFDKLQGAQAVFSKIDVQCRYHRLRIKEIDIHKAIFWMQYGHYEFLIMPFD